MLLISSLFRHVTLSEVFRTAAAVIFICFCGTALAQKTDTSGKEKINLLNSLYVEYNKTDSGEYQRLINSVILSQGTDTLYCDSAYQNITTRNFEAFGNVRIAQQGGTQGKSDYLRYTARQKVAFMRGNVSLTDGKNHLLCNELTYDLGTKTGIYNTGGTLYNDSTTVTSIGGVYNGNTKNARFTRNVVINDPQYHIVSEDVEYYTETKITVFHAKSVVTRDSGRSILYTSNGTYDGKDGIAHFFGHSSIWNSGQYIEGDSLYYNKLTSYGLANGNVISTDTQQHATLYCGHAEYFSRKRIFWATINPVLAQANGKDTFYMRADTFYSEPMIRVKEGFVAGKRKIAEDTAVAGNIMLTKDTVITTVPKPVADTVTVREKVKTTTTKTKGIKKVSSKKEPVKKTKEIPRTVKEQKYKYRVPDTKPVIVGPGTKFKDTAAADTTAPLYFIGYHHVLLFSDSLQGKCDSICYTRSDSLIRMMYAPISWARNSQVTGDTILLKLDSTKLKSMYVPNNGFIISRSGPEQAKLFDQVQGKTITAYFKDNAINHIVVFPNAESIYYVKDDFGAYLSVSQSKSDKMLVYFEDQKIKRIKLVGENFETMTPLDKADLPNMKLSRYKWLPDRRPKNKEELFNYGQ